jgi:PknH-like extracellular domain
VGPSFGDPPAIEHDDSRKWRRALDVRRATQSDSQVAQGATAEAADGYACRHAIRAVSNVVIEAAACHDHVADEANRIAENMAADVPA